MLWRCQNGDLQNASCRGRNHPVSHSNPHFSYLLAMYDQFKKYNQNFPFVLLLTECHSSPKAIKLHFFWCWFFYRAPIFFFKSETLFVPLFWSSVLGAQQDTTNQQRTELVHHRAKSRPGTTPVWLIFGFGRIQWLIRMFFARLQRDTNIVMSPRVLNIERICLDLSIFWKGRDLGKYILKTNACISQWMRKNPFYLFFFYGSYILWVFAPYCYCFIFSLGPFACA